MRRVVLVTGLQAAGKSTITNAERHLVVLNPSIEALAARERGRGSNAYRGWRTAGGSLEEAIKVMSADLHRTPRRGRWMVTDDHTPEETVSSILRDGMRASRYQGCP